MDNKLDKIILFIALCFFIENAISQAITYVPEHRYGPPIHINSDTSIKLPTICGKPNPIMGIYQGQLVYDTCYYKLYILIGKEWKALDSVQDIKTNSECNPLKQ